MMAGGLQMMAAVPGKFAFGGLVDFGISIGYNRDTQAVAIQVFGDFEKLTVNSAVILLGPVGKSGLYIANQRPGGLDHKGTSFYPPMVPGFSTMTEDTFTTGVSTGGIFTIPPSPFGDAFTYTDKYDQRVLLRLTISPLVTGFVRVELARMLIAPVSQAVTLFKRASKKIQECTSLLADSNLDDELP